MKNTKTKIILSLIIFLSVVSFVGTIDAAGASLYISPASLAKTAGSAFGASIGLNTADSKVCAVEGTLVFNNLSCQSITIADDVMVQSSPTCSNPYFLVGIPSCTTSNKTLLTVSIKAGSAGMASINFTGVDIIGEGTSISSASTAGNYDIAAPVAVQQKESTIEKTAEQEQKQEVEQKEALEAEEVVVQKQEETIPENPFLARLNSVFQKIANIWLLLVAVIIIGLGYGIFYFFKKFKIVKR